MTVNPAADGSRRYGMLEPVRQYARKKREESGETAATRERHAECFVAETAKPVFLGPDYPVWSGRLEGEHDNLREALHWARESGEACADLRLVGALSWFWWMHGYLHEGRRWAEELISRPFDVDRLGCDLTWPGALFAAGELAFGQGDLARAGCSKSPRPLPRARRGYRRRRRARRAWAGCEGAGKLRSRGGA